jgi:hypothetical protein
LLFATATEYYMFFVDDDCLYSAGNSLQSVYMGLRERLFLGKWPTAPEPSNDPSVDYRSYFPAYHSERNAQGGFDLRETLEELSHGGN